MSGSGDLIWPGGCAGVFVSSAPSSHDFEPPLVHSHSQRRTGVALPKDQKVEVTLSFLAMILCCAAIERFTFPNVAEGLRIT